MFSRDKITYEPVDLPDRMEYSPEKSIAEAEGFLERIQKRRTVRDYATEPVAREVIEACIRAAGSAPSGANHQPWHFVAISNPEVKKQIREAAEEEERKFYDGGASDEWLKALEPMGTGHSKPHLEEAAWLIVVFAQRWGQFDDGTRYKNYYVPESTGIACGFLLAALHHAGLATLTHTPNPMKFLTELLGRPESEKPIMIIAAGQAAEDAKVPSAAMMKKPLDEILDVLD